MSSVKELYPSSYLQNKDFGVTLVREADGLYIQ